MSSLTKEQADVAWQGGAEQRQSQAICESKPLWEEFECLPCCVKICFIQECTSVLVESSVVSIC